MLQLKAVFWISVALAIMVAGATGAYFGYDYASEACKAREAEAALKDSQHAVKIIQGETKIRTVYVERQTKRADEKRAVEEEVKKHEAIPDPAQCHLAPERVRNINRAWGVAPDQRGPAQGLRAPAGALERESPGSGEVGDGGGVRVPGVLGREGGAERGDQAPKPDAGGGQ